MLSAYLLQKSPLPVEIILCASSQDGISKAIALLEEGDRFYHLRHRSIPTCKGTKLVLAAYRWQAQFNVSVFVKNFLQSQIIF
ncbi:hypothetical protein [Nostoc sp.]|uniref:hypothetical protein n=1 Tax=Nostoc sp. TaxID=1180 RepID=UPI002FF8E083